MRLFLCIFDNVLGREGLLHQVTHLNNLKSLKPARRRAGAQVDSRCDLKEFKSGHLAFYGEDEDTIFTCSLFFSKGWACWVWGGDASEPGGNIS